MSKSKKMILLSLLLTLFLGVAERGKAQFAEYEIKSVQIYTFAKYVTWPDRVLKSQNKIILGILGEDPFGDYIDKVLRNRYINGKYWEIRRSNSLKDLKGSNIIFISSSESSNVRKILEEIKSYRQSSVLTIGDNIDKFCSYGGILNFTDEKYLFEINLSSATASNLIIGTQLLRLAIEIVPSEK